MSMHNNLNSVWCTSVLSSNTFKDPPWSQKINNYSTLQVYQTVYNIAPFAHEVDCEDRRKSICKSIDSYDDIYNRAHVLWLVPQYQVARSTTCRTKPRCAQMCIFSCMVWVFLAVCSVKFFLQRGDQKSKQTLISQCSRSVKQVQNMDGLLDLERTNSTPVDIKFQ